MISHLFNRDVILCGGSSSIDALRFTKKEKDNCFFVQLNHHLFRRPGHVCDWLICRKGSGMNAETFLDLSPAKRNRIRIISSQLNEPELFLGWYDQEFTKIHFPFHERRFTSINAYHPAMEWCNQFWNEIRTNPFIGMLALRMILLFPVRSVTLKGFDFFTPEGRPVPSKVSCHHVEKQTNWLTHLYHTDYRICLDQELLTLLKIDSRGYVDTFEVK